MSKVRPHSSLTSSTSEDGVAPLTPQRSAPRGRSAWSRRRIWLLVAMVLALLGATACGLWWSGYQASLNVTAATGVPRCDGTQPTDVDEGFTDDYRRVALPLTRGSTCRLMIRMENRSSHEVHLGRVTIPLGGAEGVSGFKVLDVDGRPVPRGDGLDARVEVDVPLAPGETYVLDVGIGFRGGCLSEGAVVSISPLIEIRDLLASHEVTVADLPALLGTADTSCD